MKTYRILIASLTLALVACSSKPLESAAPADTAPKAEAKPKKTATQIALDATRAAAEKQAAMRKKEPELNIPAPPDVAAPPADAETTASGLVHKVLQAGTGEAHPTQWDTVSVHYTGWTTSGAMFDSSAKRNKPASFPLRRVIPGWTEGVQLMVQGEKRRFWIPAKLAYGEAPEGYAYDPAARRPPLGTLVFDIELLEVVEGPKPPEAPKDVAKAPKNAKVTKSGLAHRRLKKGKGKKRPKAESKVQVHYSGWTTDGQLFDSSHLRGRPAAFPLNRVIPGWTEGVQLMVEGEKRRFWIPGKLAYGEKPEGEEAPTGRRRGPPLGTLVFDVELLKILD